MRHRQLDGLAPDMFITPSVTILAAGAALADYRSAGQPPGRAAVEPGQALMVCTDRLTEVRDDETARSLDGGPDFGVAAVACFGALAPMRGEVAQRLAAQGIPSRKVDGVVLVLCEPRTHAIQTTEPSDAPIRARVRFGDAAVAVAVAVENLGLSFDALDTIALGHSIGSSG